MINNISMEIASARRGVCSVGVFLPLCLRDVFFFILLNEYYKHHPIYTDVSCCGRIQTCYITRAD